MDYNNLLNILVLVIKSCPGFSNLLMAIVGSVLYVNSDRFCDIEDPLVTTLSNFTLGWFISGYLIFILLFINYILNNYYSDKLPSWYELFKKMLGCIVFLFQFIWFSLSIIGLTEIYNICSIYTIPGLSSYVTAYVCIFGIIFYSLMVLILHKPELESIGINLF